MWPSRRDRPPPVPRAERIALLRNSDLWLASGCAVAVSIAGFGIPALSPQLRDAFDLSITQIGLLVSVLFFSGALTSIPAGILIDRAGASFAVATGEVLAAAGFTTCVATSSSIVLFLGMAVIGAGYGIVSPGSTALASLEIPDNQRGLAMGIRVMGQTLGGAFAGLALPLIAHLVGWRWTLVLPVAACLVAATLALRHRVRKGGAHRGPSPAAIRAFTPPLRRLMWAYGCAMATLQIGLLAFIPIFLVDQKGLSVPAASVGYFTAFLLGSVGRVGWGIYSDSLGSRLLPLCIVALGSGVAFLGLPMLPGFAVWPALALAGLTSASWNGVYQTAIAESASAASLGRELGSASLFLFVGSFSGPALSGLLIAVVGWQATWGLAAAATSAIGLLLWRFVSRQPEPANANI
jgi:predicted MFS family arabinose efflux permease